MTMTKKKKIVIGILALAVVAVIAFFTVQTIAIKHTISNAENIVFDHCAGEAGLLGEVPEAERRQYADKVEAEMEKCYAEPLLTTNKSNCENYLFYGTEERYDVSYTVNHDVERCFIGFLGFSKGLHEAKAEAKVTTWNVIVDSSEEGQYTIDLRKSKTAAIYYLKKDDGQWKIYKTRDMIALDNLITEQKEEILGSNKVYDTFQDACKAAEKIDLSKVKLTGKNSGNV